MDIESVKALEVKQGDILVVTMPPNACMEQWSGAIRDFSNWFNPKGVEVLVVQSGTELSTISIDKEVKRMVKEEVERIIEERDALRQWDAAEAVESY